MTKNKTKVIVVGNGHIENKVRDILTENDIDIDIDIEIEVCEEVKESKKIALIGGACVLGRPVESLLENNIYKNIEKECRNENKYYYNNSKEENKKNMFKMKRMKIKR